MSRYIREARERYRVAHTGLMATKMDFTTACLGPGVERGRLSTLLKGSPGFSTTSPF